MILLCLLVVTCNAALSNFNGRYGHLDKEIEHIETHPLHIAANLGDHKKIKQLLQQKNIDPNIKDENRTPLLRACFEGHYEVVEELLKHPKLLVSETDEFGYNALHTASWKGHNLIVKQLLRDGRIDPKVMTLSSHNQAPASALHLAANNGKNGVLRLLIKDGRSDVSQLWNGESLILLAAKGGHSKVVQTLMDIGVDVNTRNKLGVTPLYAAAEAGHATVVKTLLQDKTLERKWGPHGGHSPFTMASWNGHEEVRNELLGKGKKEIVYPTYTLQDAYELTDQNNDQQISVKEIGFISERISKHTGDEIFEKYDQDNNKVLDMNELRTYLAHEVDRTDNTMSDFLSEFVGQFKNFVAHEHHNENMYQHQKHPHVIDVNDGFDVNYKKDNFDWKNFQL